MEGQLRSIMVHSEIDFRVTPLDTRLMDSTCCADFFSALTDIAEGNFKAIVVNSGGSNSG